MGRQDEWQERVIPPEYLDFATRHGLLSIYSFRGVSLYLGLSSIWGAALFVSSRDLVPEFGALLAAGLALLTVSRVFYLRKRKKDAQREMAYDRWLAEQVGRAGE
jgi:hypothetical protein